jgi:hypothetical protein
MDLFSGYKDYRISLWILEMKGENIGNERRKYRKRNTMQTNINKHELG